MVIQQGNTYINHLLKRIQEYILNAINLYYCILAKWLDLDSVELSMSIHVLQRSIKSDQTRDFENNISKNDASKSNIFKDNASENHPQKKNVFDSSVDWLINVLKE